MRIFNNQPRPTLDWFLGIVSELEKCKQTEMFENFELEMMIQQTPAQTGKPNPKTIPRAGKTKAPVEGDTPDEMIRRQIAYWRSAAADWKALGRTWYSYDCDMTAGALSDLLVALGEPE